MAIPGVIDKFISEHININDIPDFDEVKSWAQDQGWITEGEAKDAAPVQSVNGDTGEVEMDSGVSDYDDLENTPTETNSASSSGDWSTEVDEFESWSDNGDSESYTEEISGTLNNLISDGAKIDASAEADTTDYAGDPEGTVEISIDLKKSGTTVESFSKSKTDGDTTVSVGVDETVNVSGIDVIDYRVESSFESRTTSHDSSGEAELKIEVHSPPMPEHTHEI